MTGLARYRDYLDFLISIVSCLSADLLCCYLVRIYQQETQLGAFTKYQLMLLKSTVSRKAQDNIFKGWSLLFVASQMACSVS